MTFQFAATSYSIRFARLKRRQVEPIEVPGQIAELAGQRRGAGIERDEDEALPGLEADRHERVLGGLEVLEVVGVLGSLEHALQVVSPGVIRTLEAGDPAARLLEDRRAAVATDVVKRAESVVAAPDHHHALARQTPQEVLAPSACLILAADADPLTAEPVLLLEREDLGVVEDPRREQSGRPVRPPDGLDLGAGEQHRGIVRPLWAIALDVAPDGPVLHGPRRRFVSRDGPALASGECRAPSRAPRPWARVPSAPQGRHGRGTLASAGRRPRSCRASRGAPTRRRAPRTR